MEKVSSNLSLTELPATMLGTLYTRAIEAKHPNSILHDPETIRICDSLDFDFEGYFGKNLQESLAFRAVYFDRIISEWLKANPEGFIVSLGEGLETQRHRVDNGKVRWLTVDLPEAIASGKNS